MKIQVLIYPTVILAALTVFLGAMELSLYATISAFLGFVSSLLLLASIRKNLAPKLAAPPSAVARPANDLAATAELEPKSIDEQAVVQFVRNLQERGRFLDFLMADIHTIPDAQVGAVARVVHSGLKSMMEDYFAIEAISQESEGSRIAIPSEQLNKSYRLLQSAGDKVPATGILVHKGWKARAIKLPKSQRVESDAEKSILALAEIDVKD